MSTKHRCKDCGYPGGKNRLTTNMSKEDSSRKAESGQKAKPAYKAQSAKSGCTCLCHDKKNS
mgnify:CR=1 FL=1